MDGSLQRGVANAAKIGVAAAHLGIVADPIYDRLRFLLDDFGMLAWFRIDQSALAVVSGISPGPDRAATLRDLSVGIARLDALSPLATHGELTIEIGVDPAGVYATVASHGDATLAEDAAVAQALGVTATAWQTVADRLTALGGSEHRVRRLSTTIRASGAVTIGITGALRASEPNAGNPWAAFVALAPTLGASGAQLRLLERVHPILEGSGPVNARITVRDGAVEDPLVLEYASQNLDTGMRIVDGLGAAGAVKRFGHFVGAFGGEHVQAIELTVGAIDPMPARLGVVIP